MTTNSPNPVVGDVQALIADCQAEIEDLKRSIDRCDAIGTTEYLYQLQSKLKRQYAALDALTAEPAAYTDAEELETLRKGTFADMFTPHETYKADQLWIPLYTTPPAQLLRPVELPDLKVCSSDYAGSQLWIEAQVWNKAIDSCAEALRQQGYEVKS
ncbi:hypothetical protein [Pantoea ananatis]|uniref:hypothetical protein n=1 Tax=Pantoea ananas TaxID=553 RepID=UPI00188E164F|nr:hypothetical protein [Pantoea ananatis]